jgi:penicillin-binding protein 1C
LAIIVIDISNRNVISYVGNAPTDRNIKDVDIIDAPRSGVVFETFIIRCDDG